MRRTLVVLLWLIATAGVVYVANAAVELVDLQVVPGGSRIEVLSLPEPSEPASISTAPAATSTVATTTVATPSTTPSEEVTTTFATTTTTSTSVPATTTVTPTTTTTVAEAGEGPTAPVSTTTQAPAETPTTVAPAETPTTVAPAQTPTTVAPAPTTTAVVVPAETPTTVAPAETPTTVVVVPALVVSTASLAEARIGESYRAELVAVGGTPPYVWSLAVGSLPAGLGFSSGGVLSGVPVATADVLLGFAVTDAKGRVSNSPDLVFVTAPDRRTVIARGGTVFIDSAGDSVALFLAAPADGYSAVIVEPGGFRVEVQFIPIQGDATSWVVCEVDGGVVCTTG